MTATGVDLALAGASHQAALVRAGEVSVREVVQATLEQIERLDHRLNAFRVVRSERALAESGEPAAGPLSGVPVAIKDDTDVAGELTCRGTAADERVARQDAEVVARLRRAGAIVIGKTHVPELDAWGFTESMTFGATRNPWDLARSPGGSSGGSAVAVATGMSGVAHGTDGTGSLRNPAAWCGVFGFKPSRGRIPGPAALTGWHGMVVNGPMGRTVADVAAFMEATAGPGYVDAAAAPPRRLRIALTFRRPPGMGGKLDEPRRQAVHDAAELLRELGHEVDECDPALPRATTLAIDCRYLGGITADVAALPHPERLEPRTRSVARIGRILSAALPVAGMIERAAARALDEVHRDHDVLLFPGSVQGPLPIGAFHGRGALVTSFQDTARVAFQPLWNLVGRPAVMVPWSHDQDGLPTAVQLGARSADEPLLVSLAAQIEHARGVAPVPPLARAGESSLSGVC